MPQKIFDWSIITYEKAFDLFVSLSLLVLLLLPIIIVAILVRVKLGSPIIFKQQRPGLHGTPFFFTSLGL